MEVGEAALRSTGRADRLNNPLSDIADGGQAETDIAASRGIRRIGFIDVGRKYLDAHSTTLTKVDGALVLIVLHARQEGCHVLGRVVRFQVCGPVRDQSIARGMSLVEGVVGERNQDFP